MREYELALTTALERKSNVFAARGLENIYDCLRTIITTRVGTVPLYRHFGTSWDWVDALEPVAMSRLRVDIMEAIERWEPRVEVQSVDFRVDAPEGRVTPVIRFALREGVSLDD